jgi:VWFA-related protein
MMVGLITPGLMRQVRTFSVVARGAMSLLLVAALCRAQQPSKDDEHVILRSETRVVAVDVTVRNTGGKPVEDLSKADFTIIDNGKPRAFTIFSVNRTSSPAGDPGPASAEALAVARTLPPNVFTNTGKRNLPPQNGHSAIILIDGVNGWFDNFAYARQGVLGMLKKIPPDERIAIYVISNMEGLLILQDYTVDRARLVDALSKYIPHAMEPAPPYLPEGAEGMIDTGNAVYLRNKQPPREREFMMQRASEAARTSLSTLAETLGKEAGRKSLFWVTQGFPPVKLRDMDQAAWDKTISELNDANIAVNTVDSNGLGGPPRYWGPGAILTMQQISEDTGGKAYFHRNDLDNALAEGVADSRTSYTLGFYLTDIDGKYHELKVRVARPGLELNYRRGYYSRDEQMHNSSLDASWKKQDLGAALLNPAGSDALGITATLDATPGNPRGTLNLRLKLDPGALSLKVKAGGWTGKVDELFLELNAEGREVGRISVTKQFELNPENRPVFDSKGITTVQTFALPASAVKLSIVVRDTASGRVGSMMVPLDKLAQPSPH